MRVQLINPPPHQRVDQYDEPDFPRLGLACSHSSYASFAVARHSESSGFNSRKPRS